MGPRRESAGAALLGNRLRIAGGNAAIVQESGCAPDSVPVQSCGNPVAPGRSGVEKISPGPFLEVLGARHNCPPLELCWRLYADPTRKARQIRHGANPPWGKGSLGFAGSGSTIRDVPTDCPIRQGEPDSGRPGVSRRGHQRHQGRPRPAWADRSGRRDQNQRSPARVVVHACGAPCLRQDGFRRVLSGGQGKEKGGGKGGEVHLHEAESCNGDLRSLACAQLTVTKA